MYKKALGLSLLLMSSEVIMADSFYPASSSTAKTYHQASVGGVGLLIGGLAGGPIGAIIGGSMGVMTGHQQTTAQSLNLQQQSIAALEKDLSLTMTKLSDAQQSSQQAQTVIRKLQAETEQIHQLQREQLMQFATSYQFDVYFMTNSNVISMHAQQGLTKLAALLKSNEQLYANIEAHSDWRGSNDDNCLLAKQRLSAVTTRLLDDGSVAEQLLATSYGEQGNVHQDSWGDELFYDRRVTITLSYFE